MTTQKSLITLFALILLEGYVVLSSELLAIRLSVPFVGSGTDTVSVIIAAVLMPLAFGYHYGGKFKPGYQKVFFTGPHYIGVREKLIINMMIALCFLLFALSYGFLKVFFDILSMMGLTNRVGLTTLYSLFFIATPVFLLAQTIPLTCNYFSRERLSQITGRILFFSTLGSFLGAVFSTLVLMAYIGVHNTAIINFVILGLLITLISKDKLSNRTALAWALVIAGIVSNTTQAMREMYIVENNQYNTITIIAAENERHMFINNNASSMYTDDGRKHAYIEFMEDQGLFPIWNQQDKKDILVIGAGAFTIGAEDDFHNYDFVDIDKSLKGIAEKHILKKSLGPNKTFHAVPARAFLTSTEKKYDIIMLDAYRGALSLPEHLVTREFFQQVKDRLKDDGKVLANMAVAPNFANPFSRNLDNTFRSVFPNYSRHNVQGDYGLWNDKENMMRNVIYMYRHYPGEDGATIYTDNKNRAFLDRPANKFSQ